MHGRHYCLPSSRLGSFMVFYSLVCVCTPQLSALKHKWLHRQYIPKNADKGFVFMYLCAQVWNMDSGYLNFALSTNLAGATVISITAAG
jgi:hypothetical protein